MHLRLPLFLLIVASGFAHAQQQERKLEERIMKPDMTLGAAEQKKAFQKGKTFGAGNASGEKSFSMLPQFSIKSFFTKSNSSPKEYWAQKFKPEKNKSWFRSGTPKETEKAFGTKTMAVKEARDSDKAYRAADSYITQEAHMQGKSQNALNQQQARKDMSIDEIRELLNKSK